MDMLITERQITTYDFIYKGVKGDVMPNGDMGGYYLSIASQGPDEDTSLDTTVNTLGEAVDLFRAHADRVTAQYEGD